MLTRTGSVQISSLKKALKALESLYKEPSKKWIQHHEIILRSLYNALLNKFKQVYNKL